MGIVKPKKKNLGIELNCGTQLNYLDIGVKLDRENIFKFKKKKKKNLRFGNSKAKEKKYGNRIKLRNRIYLDIGVKLKPL